MGLNDDQRQEVEDVAELKVRRYFDQYLNEVFPEQVKGIKAHTHLLIEKHDGDRKAHGGAETKANRLTIGLATIIGLAGLIGTIVAIFQ